MHVEVVDTASRFIELELDWDELYARDPHANICLSSRFLASIVVRAAGKFRILIAWSDEKRCVGAFPFFVKTRWSKTSERLYNEVDMLGHIFDADYTGLLCDPDYENPVCDAFGHAMSQMSVGRITLSFFHGPESRLERLCSAFDLDIFGVQHLERRINDGKTDNLTCPYIDLPPDFSAYLATLSANARQKLRRLLRQLDEDADLKVTRSRPETYHQDASILAELWFLQYAEQKGPKRAARLKAQFKEVITVGLANGIIHLVVLWRGGKPIAAQANYIDLVKRQALFHVGGRDDTVRDLASGLLLHAHCIRWSIANGLTRYDFTLGDEPYKYSFGVSDRRISCVEIFTKSGENATGRLDETCRDDVAELIRRYAARGRSADARTAAQQALAVWPDFASTVDVEALISKASG